MQFMPSAEQTALRDNVHRYLNQHYGFQQRRAMLHSATCISSSRWQTFAELGWLGTSLPESVGGSGGTLNEAAVILAEFGRFLVLEPLLSCAVLPGAVLSEAADPEQSARLLPQLAGGQTLIAVAHGESAARGNLHFVETRATALPGGRHLLNGAKTSVIGADQADQIIVSARVGEPSDRSSNLSLFLLDPALPGVTRRCFRTIDGGFAADLTLQEVEVQPAALLGTDGAAARGLERAFEQFIVGACAEAVGIMDAVVTTTVDYLKTRRAYGSTLSSYQALQHRLADMLAELELSRSMLLRALYALSNGEDEMRRKDVCGARILVGRAGRSIASAGIQLHGALGVVDEYIIGNYLKRLNVTFALCGSVNSHLQRYAAADERIRSAQANRGS